MERLYLEQVDSTNKYCKEHIWDLKDKTLVYTFNQTSGRGRLGHSWSYVGENNIYASIVLKPSDIMLDIYSNLTQYLCVILAEVFEEYNVKPNIKWPNDILINNKKISGILAESVINKSKLEGIILGFGINLNCESKVLDLIDKPATALNILTNEKIDKNEFLNKIINKFCLEYNKFIEEGFLFIKEDYKKRASFLNKKIVINVLDKIYCGIVQDITDNGALMLIDENKKEYIFLIGDIL